MMKEFKKKERIADERGCLTFFEKGKDIDFDIKRIYYIYKLEKQKKRGFHAHKKLKQVMFCPYGSIEVELNNGIKSKKYILDSPEKILILKKGYWREFTSLEQGSVLCVGASEIYDEDDYIRDYSEYLKWTKENYNDEDTF